METFTGSFLVEAAIHPPAILFSSAGGHHVSFRSSRKAPSPPAYDPHLHFQFAVDAGMSANAAPLGFLKAGAAGVAGQVPLILKSNNSDTLHSEKDPLGAQTASVAAPPKAVYWQVELHDPAGWILTEKVVIENEANRIRPRGLRQLT